MRKKPSYFIVIYLLLIVFVICGCSSGGTKKSSAHATKSKISSNKKGSWDNTPKVLVPEESGEVILGDGKDVFIDASNTEEGYIQVKYQGSVSKVKLLITCPDGTVYSYFLSNQKGFETFSFSKGDGEYKLQVAEQIEGDRYSVLYSETLKVKLKDEFTPFLYPNQYTWFTNETEAVKKGSELARSADTDLEVIENIYTYIIETVEYDEQKIDGISSNYVPNVDETLKTKKGICFDYAALMTAMLRSQGIPTKLEIGYSGDVYHAWISTYVKEKGWIHHIIEFHGEEWNLLDPTLGANNDEKSVSKYIGDGSNYMIKYIH